jgi:hypothetical protein
MRQAGQMPCMGEENKEYKVLVRKPVGEGPLFKTEAYS